jgi:hypothetical protein
MWKQLVRKMLEDVDHILDKGQTTKWQKVAIV